MVLKGHKDRVESQVTTDRKARPDRQVPMVFVDRKAGQVLRQFSANQDDFFIGEPGASGEPGNDGSVGPQGERGNQGAPGEDAQYCPCPPRTNRQQ